VGVVPKVIAGDSLRSINGAFPKPAVGALGITIRMICPKPLMVI
jgi:hypothetical protein